MPWTSKIYTFLSQYTYEILVPQSHIHKKVHPAWCLFFKEEIITTFCLGYIKEEIFVPSFKKFKSQYDIIFML